MTSIEERMKILKMIEEGKISAEEAAGGLSGGSPWLPRTHSTEQTG